ncbi:MAG: hypothetical protein QGI77_10155, partial [Roseibacillus sp.]|nr:hypothetical protein [Roseibacillus sp.]
MKPGHRRGDDREQFLRGYEIGKVYQLRSKFLGNDRPHVLPGLNYLEIRQDIPHILPAGFNLVEHV